MAEGRISKQEAGYPSRRPDILAGGGCQWETAADMKQELQAVGRSSWQTEGGQKQKAGAYVRQGLVRR